MKIVVFHANECDKKKCTTYKMEKSNKCKVVYKLNHIPKGAIVLNPFAKKAVSPEDKKIVENRGIAALDCSWNKVSSSSTFFNLSKFHRSLPFLIASSPVNYGKPCKLTTAEAISATLYITDFKKEAENILDGFKWGHTFFELNHDLLQAYNHAKTSKDVVSIQNEFLK